MLYIKAVAHNEFTLQQNKNATLHVEMPIYGQKLQEILKHKSPSICQRRALWCSTHKVSFRYTESVCIFYGRELCMDDQQESINAGNWEQNSLHMARVGSLHVNPRFHPKLVEWNRELTRKFPTTTYGRGGKFTC